MKATIWHNPKCGTSRKTLAILEETPDVEVEVVEYLKTPFTRDKLAQLFADAGMTPAEAIRKMGTDAEERGLPDMTADAILDEMATNPAYVNRPFVKPRKACASAAPRTRFWKSSEYQPLVTPM